MNKATDGTIGINQKKEVRRSRKGSLEAQEKEKETK
jgi:hypothetical protein